MNDLEKLLLAQKSVVVLDGALATELEARGCDLNDPLWSAKTLTENPAVIQSVHEDYFAAGADIAITASYQASFKGLANIGMTDSQARDIIIRSVRLAQNARRVADEKHGKAIRLVAGSVGPYGAYLADGSEYRGDYDLAVAKLKDFHRPRLMALLDAGVDLLALETIPSSTEVTALLQLLEEVPVSAPAWFSFTLKDASHLSDGTALASVLPALDRSIHVSAIGINCVPPELVSPTLEAMAKLTTKPLLAYPNSGESWNAKSHTWSGGNEDRSSLASLATTWRSQGAKIIGGCCRTSPSDICSLRSSIDYSM